MPKFKSDLDHLDGNLFGWEADGSHLSDDFVPHSERQAELDALARKIDALPADALGPQIKPDCWDEE